MQKGLTQEQVAEHLHISQSTYARMESGETNGWAYYLESLTKLFEILPEDLVKNESLQISYNKGNSTNAFIINQLSENLLEKFDENSKLKDEIIADLKRRLSKYENINDSI